MIKVLHVTKELGSGGIESMISNLYHNIDRTEIQFDFAIHFEKGGMREKEFRDLGAEIYYFKNLKQCNGIWRYKKQWEEFWKKHREYQIIHLHYMSHEGLILSTAKRYGINVIAHSHSTKGQNNLSFAFPISRFINRNLSKKADLIFACSNAAGKDFFGKEFEKRGIILKNAIEVEKFIFDRKKREQMRKRYDLENKWIIGHVGNYTAHKNQDFMLSIFAEIVKKSKDAMLVWCGFVGEKYKSHVESLLKTYHIQDRVLLIGRCECVSDWMQAFDLFLFPSLYEGLGIVMIEAQANGLQCITSETIPTEVEITDLVYRCKLKDSAKQWALALMKNRDYVRKSNLEAVIQSGYDAKYVSLYYKELINSLL